MPNDGGNVPTITSRPWMTYLIVPPMAGLAGAAWAWIELQLQQGLTTFVAASILYTGAVVGVTLLARDLLSTRISIALGNVLWYFAGYFVWASAGPRHTTMYPVIIPVLAIVTLIQLSVVGSVGRIAKIPESGNSHPVGYCRKCGYDLRGSSTKCPECGLLIEPGDKQ